MAVTGVVKYDPVIYTHGDASGKGQPYMYCGSLISDGSQAGEKETRYTLKDSHYTISGIKCVEDPTANIKYADGKLSGTLHIADTAEYASYNKGKTVTIETSLSDADGNIWTQTDKLYVASNPVAGHTVATQNLWKGAIPAAAALGANYVAEDSYGNTDRKITNSSKKVENAFNIEDANALTIQDDWGSCRGQLYSNSAGDKITG